MKTDLFQSCRYYWLFQICWHTEWNTFTASSFRILNSSTGISSPPLALFIVMLPKANLTSYSRMPHSPSLQLEKAILQQWRHSVAKRKKKISCGTTGKESACNAGDLGLIAGLRRSLGERKGYPLQYPGLENSMDCIVHGVAKSKNRKLSNFHFLPRTLQTSSAGVAINLEGLKGRAWEGAGWKRKPGRHGLSVSSCVHVCVLSHFRHVWLLAPPWTVACQAPLSMGILQARILECFAIFFSTVSSWQHVFETCGL